ncbi:hypothetical protein [Qipengyuania sp. DGS5-3]|uniref:FliH/SctL family protein n=1 Tax=Qipengyuania sp. DGS5-3 TaxID=3349632 RepID=UPI0036D2B328
MSVLKPSQSGARNVRAFQFARPAAEDASGAALSGMLAESSQPLANSDEKTAMHGKAKAKSSKDERLALSRRIAELEEAAREASAEQEKARQEGIKEGRELGRAEAEKQDAARLQALQETLKSSHSAMLEELAAKNALSVDIARATLSRILGDSSNYAGMISETATYWNNKLASASLTKVRVSPEDFADPSALELLAQQLGNMQISQDEALKSGACLFDLELGEVDASLPVQAANADRQLREFSSEAHQS